MAAKCAGAGRRGARTGALTGLNGTYRQLPRRPARRALWRRDWMVDNGVERPAPATGPGRPAAATARAPAAWCGRLAPPHTLGNPLVTAYAVVTDGVSLHVRTCRLRFCISGTAWPIEFNFGVWVSSPYLSAFHKSWVGYLCTCARADRASVSQERLDRLSSILVCELGVMS